MNLNNHDQLVYTVSNFVILVSSLLGLLFSAFSFARVKSISLKAQVAGDSISLYNGRSIKNPGELTPLSEEENEAESDSVDRLKKSEDYKIVSIYEKIRSGAFTYLSTEFKFFIPFLIVSASLLILSIGLNQGFVEGALAGICFMTGALTSLVCGAIGMSIATYSNARTTISAKKNLQSAFITSFMGAQSYGFLLPAIAVMAVYITVMMLSLYFGDDLQGLYSIFASFGLGGSIAGLFARISGGIFTKAADVGADMVGKIEQNMNEDDPRNPAVIADNVGDNVGDIAGMGADLFGSFGEATSSAFIIIANSETLSMYKSPQLFPLVYLSLALDVAMITSLFATSIQKPKYEEDVEKTLKGQILIFSLLMILASAAACFFFLPTTYIVTKVGQESSSATPSSAFLCLAIGISGGAMVGLVTEYYTSASYPPVQELARSAETGAGTVVIFGLALGHRSTFAPAVMLGFMMYCAYYLAEFFGVVMMALGLLAFTSVILTIDAYGPICDNAGGIAEMADLDEDVRIRTDALDSAGNTTAAIGKGFAISLAYVVGMALLTSFVRLVNLDTVNVLNAFPLLGIFIGASFPYLFCSDLNKSVGFAASQMVKEVRRQFESGKIIRGEEEPDYAECINVATKASLRRTVYPFCLTLSPVLIGMLLGKKALAGFIIGVQISGVPLAISSNNSGGAWDNAKKYIEAGNLGEGKGKNSEYHHAAIVGDTVGDPMKDTSGPSINTLLKVVAIISVVFTSVFPPEGLLERYIS